MFATFGELPQALCTRSDASVPPPFDAHSVFRGDDLVVTVEGELDMGSAARLEELLRFTSLPRRRAVIDLTATDFVDSTGLRTLVSAARFFRGHGLETGVVLLDGSSVRRVFEITHLEHEFMVFGSLQEACA